MPEIGYAAAFLGGVLTLVSPCGALLLPGFFAYAFGAGRLRLAGRTLVFLLGLCAVLVPLGLGAGLLTGLVYRHQDAVTTAAGALLIVFGLVVAAGGGFALPGVPRPPARLRGGSVPVVFTLGLTGGIGGFCSGPILGSVLTLAAQSGQALRGGVLLAVYAAGMTAPLFVLAALWDRYDLGRRRWLRGRGLRVGPLRTHTTALVSGLLLVTLGVVFIATSGTRALSGWSGGTGPGAASFEAGAEALVLRIQPLVPDLAVVGVLALVLAALAWRLRRHR